MTTTRVTYGQLSMTALRGMQGNLGRLAKTQNDLTSGTVIHRMSDNPVDAQSALAFRADISEHTQYQRNGQDGQSWLGETDNVLQDALNQLQNVQQLTVQGRSTGSLDQAGRNALAGQVDQIRSYLISEVANKTYLGRPLFGGTTAGSQAYDDTGAYVGDAGQVRRDVARGVSVRVDTSGPGTFGPTGSSLFDVLSSISADLRSNPSALDSDSSALQTAYDRVNGALADVGARSNRIDGHLQAANLRLDSTKGALQDVTNVDIASASVDLAMQQAAYQSALSTTSRVLQLSLQNFLS
jgi:flagellar hook-associated protein 3 FlgL